MEKFLNPKELSEILGVKPATIYTWINRGVNIPHVKIEGTLRFREKAVEAWLLEKEQAKKKRNFQL